MRRQIAKHPYGILTLKELIGKGSYGQIYKAYASAQNKEYAVKMISSDADPDSLVSIEREIQIMLSCNHPNIVKCYSVEVVDEMVWIVMDYYSRGSLADIMARQKRTFTQAQIKNIVAEILTALVYLHDKKIIHRDIKAANILVSQEGQIKVADFGVSTLLSHSTAGRYTRTGSPLWMSPELLSNSHYTFKTDIWSLGITAMQLAQGVPPYSHQHPYRAIFSIQSHPPQSLSEPKKWSHQFNNFISKCLTLDQNKRPFASQLLKHDFITSKSTHQFSYSDNQKQNEESYANEVQHQRSVTCGTVVLHSQCNGSIWERNIQTSKTQEDQSKQNNLHGTFCIRKTECGMQKQLLSQITRALPLKSVQNIEPNYLSQRKLVQSLYAQMQQQIQKVRIKYLARIRKLQQDSSMKFEQQLKKPRDKTFKAATMQFYE